MKRHAARNGFTLAELMIALGLLAAAGAVMAPLIATVAAQRQAAEARQLGLILAENRLDELLASSWDQLLPAAAEDYATATITPLPVHLPGLQERITVLDRPDDAAKQVVVELRWKNRAGDFTTPVRISGWKFAPEGGTQ